MDFIGTFVLGFVVSGLSATAFYNLWRYVADEGGLRTRLGPISMLRLGIGPVVSRRSTILWSSASALLGFLLAVVVLPGRGADLAVTQACHRVVTTLLTTHDAVDLERSRILLGELGCDVRNDALAWRE